jgi:hypothetical protein
MYFQFKIIMRQSRASITALPNANGVLDLSNKNLTNLSQIPSNPNIKVLNVSNNQLRNFNTLAPQPNLHTIIANHNPLLGLDGLSSQASLINLDVQESGEIYGESCIIRILATVGTHLITINGQNMTERDIQNVFNLYLPPR